MRQLVNSCGKQSISNLELFRDIVSHALERVYSIGSKIKKNLGYGIMIHSSKNYLGFKDQLRQVVCVSSIHHSLQGYDKRYASIIFNHICMKIDSRPVIHRHNLITTQCHKMSMTDFMFHYSSYLCIHCLCHFLYTTIRQVHSEEIRDIHERIQCVMFLKLGQPSIRI